MRKFHTPMLFLFLLTCSLMSSCGQSSDNTSVGSSASPCTTPSTIRGVITAISSSKGSGTIGRIEIDGKNEKEKVDFDQVSVAVRSDTQIFNAQASCGILPFSQLKKGDRVQIRSTGAVRESYPPQIDAVEIVVLPAQ